MISEEMVQSDAWKSIKQTLDILKKKKKAGKTMTKKEEANAVLDCFSTTGEKLI